MGVTLWDSPDFKYDNQKFGPKIPIMSYMLMRPNGLILD